ncbi:NAD(P)H-dependent flavin oxidoreductase [Elioraea sp.]|uniref:NAD(P)H-dependent flavin oxidoreductase n=1 Tax=Elioraea sp. TaxID=2185103 RepID=UPI003F7176AE
MRTALCELLGIRHPVLLAPMAGISGGALAAAVSRAGGLGLLGGGYGNRAWLTRELAAAGNEAIGIGFITWSLARDPSLLALALDHAPRAIMLSFGAIAPFMPTLKRRGVAVIVQVQTLEGARRALAEGADVIVAQGTEAGGHGGARATLPLVPAIADIAGTVPVVAAGGIADGRGLAAALMLGAAGVLCGTVFYASTESLAHVNAKSAAVAGSGDATLRSSIFDIARGFDWPADWNLRTLHNAFTRRWQGNEPGLARSMAAERAHYDRASEAGDVSTAPVIVGEAVDLVGAVVPAGEILRAMVTEAEARLRSGVVGREG